MTRTLRTYDHDGTWQDYRTDRRYSAVLHATAYLWTANIAAVADARRSLLTGAACRFDEPALRAAYKRATLVIPQLPMEFVNNDMRFHRSRWRHRDVRTGVAEKAHCEHPWSKSKTRNIIETAVFAALARGQTVPNIATAVAEVLDARQDTVLMPSDDDDAHGLRRESEGDGLGGRYDRVLSTIIDRATGRTLGPDEVAQIEAVISHRVVSALSTLTVSEKS